MKQGGTANETHCPLRNLPQRIKNSLLGGASYCFCNDRFPTSVFLSDSSYLCTPRHPVGVSLISLVRYEVRTVDSNFAILVTLHLSLTEGCHTGKTVV